MAESKKVIIDFNEYHMLLSNNTLLERDLANIKEELKKDCKERGLYVENFYGDYMFNHEFIYPRLNIISKEAVLKSAQNETERIYGEYKRLESTIEEKNKEIARLKNRNLWQRIFNKD